MELANLSMQSVTNLNQFMIDWQINPNFVKLVTIDSNAYET